MTLRKTLRARYFLSWKMRKKLLLNREHVVGYKYMLPASPGNIVGTARSAIPEKGVKSKAPGIEAGVVSYQGQTVREVEITEELAQLEGPELLRKLCDVDSVKQALSTIVMAGQGE